MVKTVQTLFVALLSFVAAEVTAADFCDVQGQNLIKDPTFSQQRPSGGLTHWLSLQHAGEPSYEHFTEKGVFTVTRVGPQPGFIFKQRVDLAPESGAKLAFYAELEFDLTASTSTFQAMRHGGGLAVTARSQKNGQGRVLMDASLLNTPRLGNLEWHPVQVVVALPEGTRSVEAGFRLEADGVLKVRNPKLQYVDESEKPCEVTPGANMFEVKKSGLR